MDPNAQVLIAENEEDLNELTITKDCYYNVSEYTNYPFIYQVDFSYSESRAKQLLDYLTSNIKVDQIIELWRVWIGDDAQNIPYSRLTYNELTLGYLLQLYNWNDENYKQQYCLVIEK